MKVASSTPGPALYDRPGLASLALPQVPSAAPAAAASPAWVRHEQTQHYLLLNRECSAGQLALQYLKHAHGQAGVLVQALASLGSPGSGETIKHARQALSRTLAQREAQVGEVLDAHLRPHAHSRASFSVTGLESVAKVQGSGAETLLFDVGHFASGPIAVVLDDHMGAARLLRRFNSTLGQAGLQVSADPDGLLRFHVARQHGAAMRRQLAVRGEGRLFDSAAFVKVSTREFGLQADLEQAADAGRLRQLAEAGLASIQQAREYFQQQQVALRARLHAAPPAASPGEVLDFVEQTFAAPTTKGYDAARREAGLRVIVTAQARLGRATVSGLLA